MAIHILQIQEEASLNYIWGLDLNGERIPARKMKEIEKDGKISTFKSIYLASDITSEVYIKKIIVTLYINTEKNSRRRRGI